MLYAAPYFFIVFQKQKLLHNSMIFNSLSVKKLKTTGPQ
jgi:hypothetical protein